MTEFFAGIVGEDFAPIATTIFALLIALLLILFVYFLARQVLGPRVRGGNRGRAQRLQVMDASPVDGKRRIVLVRRDDVEHLVMIGGPNDLVIEPRIQRGQAAPRPRPTPTPEQVAAYRAAQQQKAQQAALAEQQAPSKPALTGAKGLAAGVVGGVAGVAAAGAAIAASARPSAAPAATNNAPVVDTPPAEEPVLATPELPPTDAALAARRKAEERAEAASRVAKEQAEAERLAAEKAEADRAALAEAESRGELGFGRGALAATGAATGAAAGAAAAVFSTAETDAAEAAPTPPPMPEPVVAEEPPQPMPDTANQPSPVEVAEEAMDVVPEPEIDMSDLENSLAADLDLENEADAAQKAHDEVPMFRDEQPAQEASPEDEPEGQSDDVPEGEPEDEERSSLEDEMDRLLDELSGDPKS